MIKLPSTVAIAGGIGAGKSCLSAALGKRLGYKVCAEPAGKNSYLDDFYRDPKRYSFACQVDFLALRFEQHAVAVDALQRGEYAGMVLDRCVYEDPVFADALHANGEMDDRDHRTYGRLFDTMLKHLGPGEPDVVIFLRVEPEVLLKRVQKRDRECERGITTEYLARINAHYTAFLQSMSTKTAVYVVDWSTFHTADETWDALQKQYVPGEKGMFTLEL